MHLPKSLNMNTGLKSLINLIFLLLSFNLAAQTPNYIAIEIRPMGIYIEGQLIIQDTNISKFKSILGKPDRIIKGANIIHTYDKLGIFLYQKPDGNTIQSFSIDFELQQYDFSPKQQFNGLLVINDQVIRKYFTQRELFTSPFINIEQDDKTTMYPLTKTSYGQNFILFQYLSSRKLLDSIHISWIAP